MNGAPWTPSHPLWAELPENIAESLREDWVERSAIMEFCGNMSRGLAEAAAYAFLFTAAPERAAVWATSEEIDRQVLRATLIRRTRVRFDKEWIESFVPWVRQRRGN